MLVAEVKPLFARSDGRLDRHEFGAAGTAKLRVGIVLRSAAVASGLLNFHHDLYIRNLRFRATVIF
jgi:hypothetical protein